MPAGSTGIVTAPTYPMLQDATLRTFLELTRPYGLLREYSKSERRATLKNGTTALFRTADDPDRLRGPNLGWWFGDEAALYDQMVYLIMIGRLRERPGRAWVTTTPRGKNWLYREFTKGDEQHRIFKAPTRSNVYLPDDYLGSLERSYGELFRAQELEGEFVDDQADALIPGEWLERCCDMAHIRSGPTRIACDLGGGNSGDRTVVLVRDDNGILALEHSRTWTLEGTATKVALLARRFDVNPNRISFDALGIGFDFGNRLAAVGLRGCMTYQGGAAGGAKFANLRTAAGWLCRQRLDPTTNMGGKVLPTFAIKREWLDLIRDEVCGLRWTIANDRRIALEKKEEYVANLGYSPDFADCFCQSFAYPGV
jgi:hypothetical protein